MKASTLLHRVTGLPILLLAFAGAVKAQGSEWRGGLELISAGFVQDPAIPQVAEPEGDLHEEMIELIQQIEGTLVRIDVELVDAAAGDAPLESPEDSGLKNLLLSSRQQMQSVVDGIDRIFEIREHHKAGGT